MRMSAFLLSLAFISSLITGCCENAVKFSRAEHAQIKTIGILTIDEVPEEYSCEDIESRMSSGGSYVSLGAVGTVMGPILGSAITGDQSTKTDALKAALDKGGFDMRNELYTNLSKELKIQGYKVIPVNIQRTRGLFIKDYNNIETKADAYLDVYSRVVGCVQASLDCSYCPWAGVHAQLVEAGTGKILYKSFPYYGFTAHYNNRCMEIGCAFYGVKKEPTIKWSNFKSLAADTEGFSNGMHYAVKTITKKIATDLK